MASSTSDEIIRLFKCYVETVTDVMKGVAEDKLLKPKCLTLQQYLENNKHLFYHQTDTFKTPVCVCLPAGCSLNKRTYAINQKVFFSLYDSTANVEIGHELKKHGEVQQTCIHKYVPKNIVIDDLDIGTLCFMLTTTASLNANEMSSVNTIRNCRNYVCHNWSKNHYSAPSVNKMWTELESSLLTLACKPYVQRLVKAGFLQHKNYIISKEDVSTILEKMSIVTEDVNQLPSKSDFDHFKDICLQNNNAMQASVCAGICEGTKTTIEEAKTIREEMGRNTAQLLQAIENVTFSIKYEGRQLVPQTEFQLQGDGTVVWYLMTPDHWDIENVEVTVRDSTKLDGQPFKINFVKKGSLFLLTTVSLSILNSPINFEIAVKSFLENLVAVCKFDTATSCHVEVDLLFLEEGNDGGKTNMELYSQLKEGRYNQIIDLHNMRKELEDKLKKKRDNQAEILQAIENSTLKIYYQKHTLVPQTGFNLQGEGKVLWHIETPDDWEVENVEATVKDNTQLKDQPIKIKFVRKGSLHLLTTVPLSILNSPANFEKAVKSFLENLVAVCKFDTSLPCQVEVDLSFPEEGNDLDPHFAIPNYLRQTDDDDKVQKRSFSLPEGVLDSSNLFQKSLLSLSKTSGRKTKSSEDVRKGVLNNP